MCARETNLACFARYLRDGGRWPHRPTVSTMCMKHRLVCLSSRTGMARGRLAVLFMFCLSTARAENLPPPSRLETACKPSLATAYSRASSAVVADRGLKELVDSGKVQAPPKRRGRLYEAWLKRRPSLVTTRITINIVLWWTLNVIFGLANKQCLNNWPHPWALACSHLAIGSACMLLLYLPMPRGDGKEWVRPSLMAP